MTCSCLHTGRLYALSYAGKAGHCCNAADSERASHGRLSQGGSGSSSAQHPSEPQEASHGMGLAAKMMAKMGWTEGKGLGRSQQGITTPLMAQKKDGRSGVIVNADSANSGNSLSVRATMTILLSGHSAVLRLGWRCRSPRQEG